MSTVGPLSSESTPGTVSIDQSLVTSYPENLECDITDARGRQLHLRPIRADDAEALVSFHSHLSPDSIYRRYFAMHPLLSPSEVSHLTQVDYQERFALIILDGEEIVAVGRYDGLPPGTTAEVAFLVRDDFQRRGLGRILLNKLASAAWSRGLTRFSAVTMRENRGMITVFEHCGFPVKLSADGEERYVTFPIDPAMRTGVATGSSQPENR